MPNDVMMLVETDQTMWTLSPDRTTVRLTLPALPREGMAEPLKVHLEFDAGAVDAILEGLILLRGQMLPPWPDAAAA